MVDLLLDTNILIYLIKSEAKYIDFIAQYSGSAFGVSVVSYIEVNIGFESKQDRGDFFDHFKVIPFDTAAADICLEILKSRKKKTLRHPSTPDIMIAATALNLGVPLVTNNPSDFRFIKELETIKP